MTVDQYAICPCGNGKKIKFCKCKDSLPELDRVMTMIEGGQIVPAMDKLNQVLSEHPDAAWALAIKGRLMMDLREYDALAENSERFVRLQPSNPLALAQRAAAELFHNDFNKATLSLLEALTESGRNVDSFVLDIASILSFALANAELYLTARAYVQLPLTAQGYESNQTAGMVFQQLNTSPDINQLLKSVPVLLPRDEDESWGERFDEAIGLLRSNQVLLAEAKLQSLARTVPREPCVLSGLLTCAVWRGDAEAQASCFQKLSECEQLEFHERARNLALSWLTDPSQSQITLPTVDLAADIQQADEAIMAFEANSHFQRVPDDLLAQFQAAEEEVPPRAAYQILDRDRHTTEFTSLESLPGVLAVALVFGKQTDRAAHIEVFEIRSAQHVEHVKRLLTETLKEISLQEKSGRRLSLKDGVQLPVAFHENATFSQSIKHLLHQRLEQQFPAQLAETPLPCLSGKTLREAASDPGTLLQRTALVQLLECDESLQDLEGKAVAAIRDVAGVAPLPAIEPTSLEEIEGTIPADLYRIQVDKLPMELSLLMFQRARLLDSPKLLQATSKQILKLDLPDQYKPVKVIAYSVLVAFVDLPEEASQLIEEAKLYATKHQLDQANLRMLELSHCLSTGDKDRFAATLRFITENYGNRPDVMARLQQMLMSLGIIRPDGTVRRGANGPAGIATEVGQGSSGGTAIWTPGSGSPTSPAAAPAAGAASSSKLWIPGMD